MQKKAVVLLCCAAIVFAAAAVFSHLRPLHLSHVWNQGVQRVDLRYGGARWFFEARRNQFRPAPVWAHRGFSVPGGFAVHSTSDGYRTLTFPGLGINWCCQQSGYRRIDVWLDFTKLAIVAALYPTIVFACHRYRLRVRRRRGLCLKCGYDLTANMSGACPECGEDVI